MRPVLATRRKAHIARPRRLLIPDIQTELAMGDDAGLDHYRRAGEMLLEAKDQVAKGRWGQWLGKNFELSRKTAYRYMALAEQNEEEVGDDTTIAEAIGESMGPRNTAWKRFEKVTRRLKVNRFAQDQQTQQQEMVTRRTLALQLIDLGYRALATRLHPDRGGSKDAMVRLIEVRDELKSVAANRRFV